MFLDVRVFDPHVNNIVSNVSIFFVVLKIDQSAFCQWCKVSLFFSLVFVHQKNGCYCRQWDFGLDHTFPLLKQHLGSLGSSVKTCTRKVDQVFGQVWDWPILYIYNKNIRQRFLFPTSRVYANDARNSCQLAFHLSNFTQTSGILKHLHILQATQYEGSINVHFEKLAYPLGNCLSFQNAMTQTSAFSLT